MYQTGTYKLALIKEPQMQVLELPYVNNKLSMIILLPVGTASLEQVKLENANVQRKHVCTCVCARSCTLMPHPHDACVVSS